LTSPPKAVILLANQLELVSGVLTVRISLPTTIISVLLTGSLSIKSTGIFAQDLDEINRKCKGNFLATLVQHITLKNTCFFHGNPMMKKLVLLDPAG
jgi:hypothetical protein